MKIFLDFDGVLRRESSPKSRLDQDCVHEFELAVASHADARVVITSTWRLVHQLDTLRRLFSRQFASRIEGITPDLPDVEDYARDAEVHAYLNLHGLTKTRWIAVDDDPDQYKPRSPVIRVDPSRGFDAKSANQLRDWLASA